MKFSKMRFSLCVICLIFSASHQQTILIQSTEKTGQIESEDDTSVLKKLATIESHLAEYFKRIETYFISILTLGNQRITAHDEQLAKILEILRGKLDNSSLNALVLASTEKQANFEAISKEFKIQEAKLDNLKFENYKGAKVPTEEVNFNYYFSDKTWNWYAAERFCERLNWTLVSIKTEAQMQLIWNLTPKTEECYWTGGTDMGRVAGDFRWSQEAPVLDDLWGTGQPDGVNAEAPSCLVVCGKHLYDQNCLQNEHHFVCQNFI